MGTFIRFYLVSWLGERISADIRKQVFDNIVRLHPGFFETNRSWRDYVAPDHRHHPAANHYRLFLQHGIAQQPDHQRRAGHDVYHQPEAEFDYCRGRAPGAAAHSGVWSPGEKALQPKPGQHCQCWQLRGEVIQHIRVVQSYTREQFESEAFDREVERAFAIARRRIWQRSMLICGAILLLFVGMSGMLWEGGQDVISGRMSGGELGAFVFYAIMVGSGVATISEVWGELQRAAGAAERLVELINTRSLIEDPGNVSYHAGKCKPELRMDHVTFCYPTRPNQPALQDFTLHIEAGKSLALVGPSGAGKSTVFELLLRFYDPQQGRILLDGQDIRDMGLQQMREHIALVPQQPALFTGDVRYNIAYGKLDATDEEVEAAARAAHAHDFICALPDGYASHLGEMGVRLSGGQRQRIALARAILNDPKILLLDEATSALDTESEHQVQLALQELMQNRTTVIIAHRLSTILHADNIAVLDAGKLIATGTHEQLLRDCALYARLASLQFRETEISAAELPDPAVESDPYVPG